MSAAWSRKTSYNGTATAPAGDKPPRYSRGLGAARADGAALVGLALLAVVQLWPLAGPARLPENLDLMLQYVPNASYLARGLRELGRPALWNPYQGTGMPFAADPGAGAWYLPAWPFLRVLPLFAAVRAILWLHLSAAAAGTYVVGRRVLGVGPAAAWIGAAAFALTPWLPGLAGIPTNLVVIAWLPWMVWLGTQAARRGGRWVVALGAAGALQAVAGWPPGAYLSWAAAAAIGAGGMPTRRSTLWGLFRVGVAGVLTGLVSGVLLVPALEFLGQTNYAETRPVAEVAQQGYLTLLSWFRPASGTGAVESEQLYLGMTPLVLAMAGIVAGRRRVTLLFGGLALVAMVVAMGIHGPLFEPLYRSLPGFRIVHLPSRAGVVAAFALACLAAEGAGAAQRQTWSRRKAIWLTLVVAAIPVVVLAQFWWSEGYDNFRRVLTNVGRVTGTPFLTRAQEAQYVLLGTLALAIVVAAAGRRVGRRGWVAGATIALTAIDLAFSQWSAHPAAFEPAGWYATAEAAASLTRFAGPSNRLTGLQWHGTRHFLNEFPRSTRPELLPPNLGQMVGVRDPAAYGPLLLRRAVNYFAEWAFGERDDHWLWLDRFQPGTADRLGVFGVLTVGAEWRVFEEPIGQPVRLPADGSEYQVWSGAAKTMHTVRVISYLGEATDVPQGTAAIQVRLRLDSGAEQVLVLRAGIETAEWAYGRPDVQARVRHQQAPVTLETRLQGAVSGTFLVYQYMATFEVGDVKVKDVSARSLIPGVTGFIEGLWISGPDAPPPVVVLPIGPEFRFVIPRYTWRRAQRIGSESLVRYTLDEPERVTMITTGVAEGTLVLADAFYPGWEADVDGVPTRIDAAEGLFRSVALPPGDHVVDFRYRPQSLAMGGAATGSGALLAVGLLYLGRPRRA